jgi:hypothetical protein
MSIDLNALEQHIAACPDSTDCHFWHCSDMANLLARVRQLEAGLAEYGQHKEECPARPRWAFVLDPAYDVGPCDCGLAALAGEG